MNVEISVRTKAGDMNAECEWPTTMGESGTAYVREGIIEAANRILRGYGLEELKP